MSEAAKLLGVVTHGITVPAFILGGRSGSCNFCSLRTSGLAQSLIATDHIVGSFAFQKASRIAGGRLRPIRAARLSIRSSPYENRREGLARPRMAIQGARGESPAKG